MNAQHNLPVRSWPGRPGGRRSQTLAPAGFRYSVGSVVIDAVGLPRSADHLSTLTWGTPGIRESPAPLPTFLFPPSLAVAGGARLEQYDDGAPDYVAIRQAETDQWIFEQFSSKIRYRPESIS